MSPQAFRLDAERFRMAHCPLCTCRIQTVHVYPRAQVSHSDLLSYPCLHRAANLPLEGGGGVWGWAVSDYFLLFVRDIYIRFNHPVIRKEVMNKIEISFFVYRWLSCQW